MSEYWVSNKKYFCKYCEIFIADDAPSRTQHENGLRHQGNKERFIRSLYKNGEKKKREDEEERREMSRIEMAAQAAFANDVQSGRAKATSSSSVSLAPKPAAPKPSTSGGVYANYTTAKDLGIAQEEEKLAEEALALQQSQGVVGQWEVVDVPKSSTPSNATIPQKRYHQEDEDEEGEGFRIKKKKLAVGLGEIYDPGKISLEPRSKQKEEVKTEVKDQPQTSTTGQPSAPIVWSKKRWKADNLESTSDDEGPVKMEEGEEQKAEGVLTTDEGLKEEAPED
ncbi:hypothetical protein CPB86DRAFT_741681, partial [Serendipita vermifera]